MSKRDYTDRWFLPRGINRCIHLYAGEIFFHCVASSVVQVMITLVIKKQETKLYGLCAVFKKRVQFGLVKLVKLLHVQLWLRFQVGF